MSFPLISTRQRRTVQAARLGSQFAKRLARGLVIDRATTAVGVKIVRTVPAPGTLQRGSVQ